MGTARNFARNLDMYKKVPGDLLEGSKQGSAVSWIAIILILILFYKETLEYWTSRVESDLYLDRQFSEQDQIVVKLNITMTDLMCEYVEIDVVSVLGDKQNVTKSVMKYAVDAHGILQGSVPKVSIPQHFSLHDETVTKAVEKSIEELEKSNEEVISLDSTTLTFALNENDLVFVDFFASWCSHCTRLAPTWEMLAKIMADSADKTAKEEQGDTPEKGGEEVDENELQIDLKLKLPVMIAKVDCVEHHDLCVTHNIMSYPTLRLFVNGEPYAKGDYRGQRYLMDMIQYIRKAEEELDREGKLSLDQVADSMQKHLNVSTEERHWMEALDRIHHHHQIEWNPDEHPGCQIVGSILINRVPGNFHIEAFSPNHDLAPHMTNVSHQINSLSFIPTKLLEHREDILPNNFGELTRPLNGDEFITRSLHQAYHHYLKLVTTNGNAYQVLCNSQLAIYPEDDVPEAKFIIDLSPIAVRYHRVSRHWYDYITSLMAIIGGTFTVVGIFESGVRQASRRMEHRRQSRMAAASRHTQQPR